MIDPSDFSAEQIEWELPATERRDVNLDLLLELSPEALILTVARLQADNQALRLTLSAAMTALHSVTIERDEWRTLRRR